MISIVDIMEDIEAIARRYEKLSPVLDERMRRLWAGMESSVIGFGGIAAVSKATGLSRNTITSKNVTGHVICFCFSSPFQDGVMRK